MLIQSISSSPVPAPPASSGSMPDSGASALKSSTPIELPQKAVQAVDNSPQPSNAQLQTAIDKLNQAMQQSNTNLEFSIDRDSKRPVIKVVDKQTGETIKQFPSEEAIAISKAIDQFQKGLLFKQKA